MDCARIAATSHPVFKLPELLAVHAGWISYDATVVSQSQRVYRAMSWTFEAAAAALSNRDII